MKLVKSLVTTLMEMAAGPMGFAMDETMSGTHRFVEDDQPTCDLPMSFTLTWGTQDLRTFLDPRSKEAFCTADAKGHVTIAGLVEDADRRGWRGRGGEEECGQCEYGGAHGSALRLERLLAP